MATRAVLQTFERYQKERVAFVTAVSEMAKNPQVSAMSCGQHANLPAQQTGGPLTKAPDMSPEY
jgi:hypothetical protein